FQPFLPFPPSFHHPHDFFSCDRPTGSWDRRFMHLDTIWTDVRYPLRCLRRSRTFTATAILTLALGIGAATAVFAVVDAVLLRPLPYADPDRLVGLNSMQRGADGTDT